MMTEDRPGDTSFLKGIFRHNTWANQKLLDFCAGLTAEQRAASAVGTYGPIQNTLGHMIYAEVDYVGRATGKTPPLPIPTDRLLPFETMKDIVRWTGDQFEQLAVNARAENIVREDFPDEHAACEYPLASMLVQAINHSTEHRAHVATVITQLGLQPPDMQPWEWMVETGVFKEFHEGRADGV
jgi:uncharacterized damage-inducible protein DinB